MKKEAGKFQVCIAVNSPASPRPGQQPWDNPRDGLLVPGWGIIEVVCFDLPGGSLDWLKGLTLSHLEGLSKAATWECLPKTFTGKCIRCHCLG